MAESPEDFGVFGTEPSKGARLGFFGSVIKWIVFLAVLGFVPFAIGGWNDFYDSLAENQVPKIEVLNAPPGIGLDPVKVRIKVRDEHSGLDEIIVRSKQGDDVRTMVKKRFEEKQHEDTIILSFDGRDSGFHEGKVSFAILAFDRSFWSNRAKITLDLPVDYVPPRIEVLSSQHNAVRGGVELAFYTLGVEGEAFSGVTVGSRLFPGFPAEKLDSDYSAVSDAYFAFFAVPHDYAAGRDSVRLIARDPIGNTTTASIYYRVRDRRVRPRKEEVTKEFLDTRVEELYAEYQKLLAEGKGIAAEAVEPASSDAERIKRFKELFTGFKPLIEDGLKPLFGHPKAERFWNGSFGFPVGGRVVSSFGMETRYLLGDRELWTATASGVDFAVRVGSTVRAANSGIIIFADSLGMYGKTVIVDHGFGLTSFYSHLFSVGPLEGTRVAMGDIIGTSGSTGFTQRPVLHFEMRLHGVPIRPAEWWDKKWVKEHVEQKVYRMKSRVGIRARRPLD